MLLLYNDVIIMVANTVICKAELDENTRNLSLACGKCKEHYIGQLAIPKSLSAL